MIKILLVDDEQPALELMQALLKPLQAVLTVCGSCTGIQQAISEIKLQRPDILLLDIELGDGLSFEILEQFPDTDMRIIFVTAHDDYILKAIKVHAFDYIFKPLVPSEFLAAVQKAMSDIESKKPPQHSAGLLGYMRSRPPRKIAVPSRNGLSYYNIDDIVYIEADGSYAIIHFLEAKPVTISRKVKDFESSLADSGFLRVHKSFVVNMNHISQLHREDSGYLVMSNQAKVPISPKDKEQVLERIRQFCTVI